MLGVVNDVEPVDNAAPPEAAAYQSTVIPDDTVADNETVPVPYLELSTPTAEAGNGFTVAVAIVLEPFPTVPGKVLKPLTKFDVVPVNEKLLKLPLL